MTIFVFRKKSLNIMSDYILGIESSCDDTSAAVLKDGFLLSNVIASQQVHKDFGGVVPELASRAHEQNIVPVVSQALDKAGINPSDLTAIAFTRGPGLLGSLLVGTSFAKALGIALDIPIIMVNHLQGHILAGFVDQEGKENRHPAFPYLCLLVSGGNSQIVRVDGPLEYTILGQTIDDAVGEAFDKCSKMMGLGYPGGPVIDRLAQQGANACRHAKKNHSFHVSFASISCRRHLSSARRCVRTSSCVKLHRRQVQNADPYCRNTCRRLPSQTSATYSESAT